MKTPRPAKESRHGHETRDARRDPGPAFRAGAAAARAGLAVAIGGGHERRAHPRVGAGPGRRVQRGAGRSPGRGERRPTSPTTPPWPAPLNALPAAAAPEHMDGLRDSLASIGVPVGLPPEGARGHPRRTGACADQAPGSAPVPTDGGSVIVVVGPAREAQAAAGALVARTGLAASDLLSVERTDAGRQRVARRRSSNKVTVVVVEASLRARHLAAVASWIEQVKPDHVVGAVPATAKRADVEHWRAQVGPLRCAGPVASGGHRVAGRADGAAPDRAARRGGGLDPALGVHAPRGDAGAGAVRRRDYHALTVDIRRFRPIVVIVLAIVVLLPSLDEMVTQGLSPLVVLARLAESLAVVGALVWVVSARGAPLRTNSGGVPQEQGAGNHEPWPDLSIQGRPGSLVLIVDTDDLFVQLVEALDRDLELLAVLRYRLIVLGALAGADQGPSIPTAVREIELAYEDLRLADLVRATATVRVAEEFDLDPMPRLDQLAARASGAWSEVLTERRRSIIETVIGIESLASTVRAAMGRRASLAKEALAFLRIDCGCDLRALRRARRGPGGGIDMSDMGLSIAASGLAADTAELDTASNNLSNIDTPGYAAEQVELTPEAAAGPLGVGQGVVVGSVSELTDAVYEASNVAAEGVQGAATQTSQVMSSVESIFPEPSSTGHRLPAVHPVVRPLDPRHQCQSGRRRTGGGRCGPVGGHLHQWQLLPAESAGVVAAERGRIGCGRRRHPGHGEQPPDGGGTAQRAASWPGPAGGQDVNALSDESRSAVNQLASLLGVNASTAASGSVSVYLNGVQLVAGDVAQTLSTTGSAGTANLAVVTANGVTVETGGSIGANLTAVEHHDPGVPGATQLGGRLAGHQPEHAAGERDGRQRRSGLGDRRGVGGDDPAQHLRQRRIVDDVHAEPGRSRLGGDHRGLPGPSRHALADRHRGGAGAGELERDRDADAGRDECPGDGGARLVRHRDRRPVPVHDRCTRHAGGRRHDRFDDGHAIWPPPRRTTSRRFRE